MANDYVVNIVLKAKEEAAAAFAGMSAHMVALTAEVALTNEALKHLNETGREHGQMLRYMGEDLSAATMASTRMAETLAGKLTPAMNNVNKASGNNGGAASGLMAFVQGAIPGQQTAGNITIAIAAAAAAFAPFTAELAASLVLMGAWVVGAAAFIAVIGIAALGVLGLAGGIAALGIAQMGGLNPAATLTAAQTKLTTAINQTEAAQEAVRLAQLRYDAHPTAVNLQVLKDATEQLAETQRKQVAAQNAVNAATTNANGPMATLRQSISDMATTLGQAAIPMTTQMLNALIPLVPRVQAAGQSLIDWFGPRLPAVLVIAQQAFGNLLAGLQRVAEGWGQLIDHVLARSPEFGNIINGAFNRVIDGVLGLLDNLVKLSDWFVQRLPTLGANANSTFANLGFVVQGLGVVFGGLVDWIIAHWPAINAMFNASWDAFKQGWGVVQPILQAFGQNLKDLQPLFQYIQNHADNLKVIYWALGAAVALVVAALEALFVILVLVTGGIVALGDAIHGSLDALHSGADAVGSWWNGASSAVGKALDAIIGKHKDVGQSAKDAAAVVDTATTGVKGSWGTTAGPGKGSVSDSATTINAAAASVGGSSSAAATQVHASTGSMAGDYSNLSTAIDTSGGHIRADNLKTAQSTSDAATGMTAAWDWITKVVKQSDHENEIAVNSLRNTIDKSMKDNIGALEAFQKEHGAVSHDVQTENAAQGVNWQELSRIIGKSMDENGRAVNQFAGTNMNRSNDIQNTNSAQGVNWRELGRIIGLSMDQNGQALSNFGGSVRRLNDYVDFAINHVLGPDFSTFGTNMRALVAAIGHAFDGLGGNIHGGLQAVASALNNFGSAVSRALSPFGVDIKPVATSGYAEGGVVPGYAPGQDSVLAMLSPGEGILTPQTVRGMGGPSVVEALNSAQGLASPSSSSPASALADMGAMTAAIGAWGGQCVAFLQNLLGLTFHGDARTWVNAPYAHTQVGAPGELAVFTAGWYGHLALVTKMITDSVFEVLDSNWVAPETIGRHVMDKSMYGFATFLNPGISAIGQFLSGIPGLTSPADLLNGLGGWISTALGGLGGWEGTLAKGLMEKTGAGVKHFLHLDSGGGLPPGGTFAWNGTGRTETVTPASTMDKVESLLGSIDARLAQLAGQPRLGAQLAMVRNGG